MMGIFGSSLPTGVSQPIIDQVYGAEQPCEVCMKDTYDCICPECPVCAFVGDLKCYEVHGMVRSEAQTVSYGRVMAEQHVDDCKDNVVACMAAIDTDQNCDTSEREESLKQSLVTYQNALSNLIGWYSR